VFFFFFFRDRITQRSKTARGKPLTYNDIYLDI